MFTAEGGHDPTRGNASFYPKTAEEARQNVRELKVAQVDVVKLVVDDYERRIPSLNADIEAAIIDEAHRLGLKAYAHAVAYRFAAHFIEMGGDGLVHGITDEEVNPGLSATLQAWQAPYITTSALYESLGDIPGFARRQPAFDVSGLMSPERLALITDMIAPALRTEFGEKAWKLHARPFLESAPTCELYTTLGFWFRAPIRLFQDFSRELPANWN
jgi:hypothetical protein